MSSAEARPEVDDSVVREALVAAVEVARQQIQDPDVAATVVPRPLWRICGFRSLSKASLSQVRKVLGADAEFRSVVAASVTSDDVDEASWLFLHRPEGWLDRLAAIAEQDERSVRGEAAADDERGLQRRLKAAESARQRADSELDAQRARVEALAAELDQVKAARAELERQLAQADSALEDARLARDEARARIRAAEGKQAEEAHRVAQVSAARDLLRAERDELRNQLDELRAPRPTSADDQPAESEVSVAPPPVGLDPGIADAVESAALAASSLAASLSDAARRLRPTSDAASNTPATVAASTARPSKAAGERRRRRPVALPPGVFDDSPEAARHLLGVPGMVLIVDGYNLSIRRWPDVPIEEQRRRLVAMLTEVRSRFGARAWVVFDGAEPDAQHRPASRGVSVSFTQEGREADDAIIDAVATLAEGPVVVASDDHRVRDGAARAGASLLRVEQLLAALRRDG